jgi:NTP pyrophosphatase (non-canonical NTP hydrolase)
MESIDVPTTLFALADLQRRALEIKRLYDESNLQLSGRTWTNEEFMLGFVGDVGDLAKLVMAAEGARSLDGRKGLGHELADCLWSVLVLADAYDVDLASEFESTMDEIATRLRLTETQPEDDGAST